MGTVMEDPHGATTSALGMASRARVSGDKEPLMPPGRENQMYLKVLYEILFDFL